MTTFCTAFPPVLSTWLCPYIDIRSTKTHTLIPNHSQSQIWKIIISKPYPPRNGDLEISQLSSSPSLDEFRSPNMFLFNQWWMWIVWITKSKLNAVKINGPGVCFPGGTVLVDFGSSPDFFPLNSGFRMVSSIDWCKVSIIRWNETPSAYSQQPHTELFGDKIRKSGKSSK